MTVSVMDKVKQKAKCLHRSNYFEDFPTYKKYICSKCGAVIGIEMKREEQENE